jgi:hypothetical protein
METLYSEEEGMPDEFWSCLKDRRRELLALKDKIQSEVVSPFDI